MSIDVSWHWIVALGTHFPHDIGRRNVEKTDEVRSFDRWDPKLTIHSDEAVSAEGIEAADLSSVEKKARQSISSGARWEEGSDFARSVVAAEPIDSV
jgi:hypothetical protein